ncbi:hypothetical protein UFOVP223_12 [uncultured Caudovirales phage]|uniref:Uncharacterized protein n=1 Tax=uncultured Caudovirales phage TaxID=2100421 RepID=A0A6J7WQE5_9CAUD|nr:hypothetical protein UFOVP110_18 [uncultured Caudovirales phage]CAB5218945.1 hypothetical protein UFOVP223_12 [uncultured Caudovirales phage]
MAGNPGAFNLGGGEGRGDSGTAGGSGILPTSDEVFSAQQASGGTEDTRSDVEKYGVETQVIQHDRGPKKIRLYHPETGEVIPKRPAKYDPKFHSDPDGNRYMPQEELDQARESDRARSEWDEKYRVVSKLPAAKSRGGGSSASPRSTAPTAGAVRGSQPVPTAKPGEVQTALGNQIAALKTFHATSAQTVSKSGDEAAIIYHHALGQALDLAQSAHNMGAGRMRQRAPQYASEHFRDVAEIISAAHGFATSEPMSRIVGAPPVSADEVSAWGAHAHNATTPRRGSFSYNIYTLGTRKTAEKLRQELMAKGDHAGAAAVTNSFDPKDMDADALVQLGKSLGMKADTLDWKGGSNINQGVLKAAVAGQGANQGVRVPRLERKESEARGETIEVVDPLTGEKKPYATKEEDTQFNPEATTAASTNLGARGDGLRVGTYQPPSGPGERPREGEARYEVERSVGPEVPLNLGAFPGDLRTGETPSAGPMVESMESKLVATGLPEAHPQAAESQAREAERNVAPVTAAQAKSGETISGDAELTPEVQREIQRQKDRLAGTARTQARFDSRWTPEQQAQMRADAEKAKAEDEAKAAKDAVDASNATAETAQAQVDKTLKGLKERKPRKRGK